MARDGLLSSLTGAIVFDWLPIGRVQAILDRMLRVIRLRNTTCREVWQDSARASRGIARMIAIEATRPGSRFVGVAVDSSNHPRFFTSMVNRKAGTTMKMQSASASYDATGRMSQAVRTFTTRDITSGTGDSKSVALSDADTARVRSLTAEVLRRCIR